MTLQNSKTNTDPMQPKTQGPWTTEKQDDGSTWLIGPDPQTGEDVCIAAFELQADAEYVAALHNKAQGIPPDVSEALGTKVSAKPGVVHKVEGLVPMDAIEVLEEAAAEGTLVTLGTDTKFRITLSRVKYDPVDAPQCAQATIMLKATSK